MLNNACDTQQCSSLLNNTGQCSTMLSDTRRRSMKLDDSQQCMTLTRINTTMLDTNAVSDGVSKERLHQERITVKSMGAYEMDKQCSVEAETKSRLLVSEQSTCS
eukprot:1507939-Rhodomonas_salina.1